MLGENHSLVCDFPTFAAKIKQRVDSDSDFAEKAKLYNNLDEEIRDLELQNSPIDDGSMHDKKRRRAELKDELYQQLLCV